MKKKVRRWVALAAGLVFVCSVAMVGYQHYQYRLGAQVYTQAAELAGVPDFEILAGHGGEMIQIPEETVPSTPVPKVPEEQMQTEPVEAQPARTDPYADALAAMDFAALREVNPEVRGWIFIPDTPVSYPLMQGEDNVKYLDTTWRGTGSSVGSVFLECRNSADLSDFNTIIYGHRTVNRSMFGSLKDYADEAYWNAHPCIYITDDTGCKTYAVFAAYEVGVRELTYRLGFDNNDDKVQFLDFCVGQSVIETGIVPEVDDRILTLSTCTGRGYDTRWVVQAVLV